MNIEIKIDENCEKDKIIIITKEINKRNWFNNKKYKKR